MSSFHWQLNSSIRRILSTLLLVIYFLDPLCFAANANVNITEGYYSYNTVDLALGGQYPLFISRHYQSALPGGGLTGPGPFGLGTNMGSYSLRADIVTGSNNTTQVALSMPTGGRQYFVPAATPNTYINQFQSDPIQGIITVSGSTVTLTQESGLKINFTSSSSTRTLNSIVDRYGKAITLIYSNGNLVQISDLFGRSLHLSYTNPSYPSQVTRAELFDAVNTSYGYVQYIYNSEGDLATFKNAIDGQTTLGSDGQSRTVNGQTSYFYTSHHLVTITDPRGVTALANTYDTYGAGGKVIQQRLPGINGSPTATADDIVASYTYGSNNTVVNDTSNAADHQLIYQFDPTTKNITQLTASADGSFVSNGYDSTTNNINSFSNIFNQTTFYNYSFDGTYSHLFSTTEPSTATTTYSFTGPFGQLSSLTDTNQNATNFTYFPQAGTSNDSKLAAVSSPLPVYSYYDSYNSYGQLLQSHDALNRVTVYSYYDAPNGYQDFKSIALSSGVSHCYTYDNVSRVKESYFCNYPSQKTTFVYDQSNRITSVTVGGNRTTKYTYDDNSNLTSVTAANGVKTAYQYNDQNLLASRQQGQFIETYAYNNLGQLVSYQDRKAQLSSYSYDAKGRLSQANFAPDNTSLVYNYNQLDQVTDITDSSDSSGARNVHFDYATDSNKLPHLLKETTGAGTANPTSVAYDYDNLSNLTSLIPSSGSLLTYSYFEDNSLKTATITDADGNGSSSGTDTLTFSFNYDSSGALFSMSAASPNNSSPILSAILGYNVSGDIKQLTYASGPTTLRQVNYSYDYDTNTATAKGNLVQRTETGSSVATIAASQKYTYNEVGELTCSQTNTVACPTSGSGNYSQTLDSDGNPTAINNSGSAVSVTYQPGTNRLATYAGRRIVIDANGNLTDDGKFVYQWNARDQLVLMTSKVGTARQVSFTYDALGRRTSKTDKGVVTTYTYSGDQVVSETTNGATKRFLVTPGGLDGVLATYTSSFEYYLSDAYNGSMMATVSPIGVTPAVAVPNSSRIQPQVVQGPPPASLYVTTSYGYTPFGQPYQTFTSSKASSNELQYAGRENDGTGLYYYRSRYYSYALQRFLSEDPAGFAGGDTNLYRYASNSPHVGADPTGLRQVHGAAWLNNLSNLSRGASTQSSHSKMAQTPDADKLQAAQNISSPSSPTKASSLSGNSLLLAINDIQSGASPNTRPSRVFTQDQIAFLVPPTNYTDVFFLDPVRYPGTVVQNYGSNYANVPVSITGLPTGVKATVSPAGSTDSQGQVGITIDIDYSTCTVCSVVNGEYKFQEKVGDQTFVQLLVLGPTPYLATQNVTVIPGGKTIASFSAFNDEILPPGTVFEFLPDCTSLPSSITCSDLSNPTNTTPAAGTSLNINASKDAPFTDPNNPPSFTVYAYNPDYYIAPGKAFVQVANQIQLNSNPLSQPTVQSSVSYQLTIIRPTGDRTPLDLLAEGLPSGITATFNPQTAVTGNASTLTLEIDPSVPDGTYNFFADLILSSSTNNIAINPSGKSISRVGSVSTSDVTPAIFQLNESVSKYRYIINISPQPQVTTTAGSSANFTIGILKDSRFTSAPLNLKVTGLSQKLVPHLASSRTSATSDTLSIDIPLDVLSNGQQGQFDFYVEGVDDNGEEAKYGRGTILVNPAQVLLKAGPENAPVSAGQQASFNISFERSPNYTGAVTLATNILPAGATASFSPTGPNTGNSANLTIRTSPNTPTGVSTISVDGTADNAVVVGSIVTLTINLPPIGGGGSSSTNSNFINDLGQAAQQLQQFARTNPTVGAAKTLLQGVALVPGLGTASSVALLGIDLAQGDYAGVVGDALGLIPIGGGELAAGSRLAREASAIGREAQEVGVIENAIRTCGAGSFTAGTSVLTAKGSRPIEEIKVGEQVLSRDEHTGVQDWHLVMATTVNKEPVYRLHLHGPKAGDQEGVGVSAEHPFWVKSKGWTAAEELKFGSEVLGARSEWLQVESFEPQSDEQTTYNLSVEGSHSFFVGQNQAWVHNNNCHFDDLARMRQELGLPAAGAKNDKSTVAKLVVGDREFYGINARSGGLSPGSPNFKLTGKNWVSPTHAEGDALNSAFVQGVNGGDAVLYVDRTPCPFCSRIDGLPNYASQLGLNSLTVVPLNGAPFKIIPHL